MVSPAYYRAEAKRCHKLAEEAENPDAAHRWRALARDYNALADQLDESGPAPVMHVPMQQQPLQQQQTKLEPKDE